MNIDKETLIEEKGIPGIMDPTEKDQGLEELTIPEKLEAICKGLDAAADGQGLGDSMQALRAGLRRRLDGLLG